MRLKRFKTGLFVIALSLLGAAGVFFTFDTEGGARAAQTVSPAFSAADGVLRPWDVSFEIVVFDKRLAYSLSENIGALSEEEKEDRLVYRSVRLKKRWIKQATDMGFDEVEAWCYLLPGLKELVKQAESALYKRAQDASVSFAPETKSRFVYKKEVAGVELDKKAFAESLSKAVSEGGAITARGKTVLPEVSLEQLKRQTTLKCRFSTWYGNSTAARKSNVKRALKAFQGMTVENGERVSFNEAVGPRTKQNGFFEAKIIMDGKYVQGVGGGVCQASTTLFNALIMSGVTVNKVHQHSLASSYVAPSFDAMVSSVSDLVFTNETGGRIFIAAYGTDSEATVEIYGLPNEYEIRRRSVEIARKPFSTRTIEDREGRYSDKVVFDTDTFVLSNGADGLTSEGWLDYYQGGKLVKSRKIRTNTYLPTERVVVKGVKARPQEGEESGAGGDTPAQPQKEENQSTTAD